MAVCCLTETFLSGGGGRAQTDSTVLEVIQFLPQSTGHSVGGQGEEVRWTGATERALIFLYGAPQSEVTTSSPAPTVYT